MLYHQLKNNGKKGGNMENAESKLFNEHILDENKNIELLFEQYKLYVELTDKNCERRQNMSKFFLSLNSTGC